MLNERSHHEQSIQALQSLLRDETWNGLVIAQHHPYLAFIGSEIVIYAATSEAREQFLIENHPTQSAYLVDLLIQDAV